MYASPEGGSPVEGGWSEHGCADLVIGEKRSPLPRAGDCFGGQPAETMFHRLSCISHSQIHMLKVPTPSTLECAYIWT